MKKLDKFLRCSNSYMKALVRTNTANADLNADIRFEWHGGVDEIAAIVDVNRSARITERSVISGTVVTDMRNICHR